MAEHAENESWNTHLRGCRHHPRHPEIRVVRRNDSCPSASKLLGAVLKEPSQPLRELDIGGAGELAVDQQPKTWTKDGNHLRQCLFTFLEGVGIRQG